MQGTMKIINQTDKVIKRQQAGPDAVKRPKNRVSIPGLSRMDKTTPQPRPASTRSASTTRSTTATSMARPTTRSTTAQATQYTDPPKTYQTNGADFLQNELNAFMQPLNPLMDWDHASFSLNDAMALDTQWLEGLDFPTTPTMERETSVEPQEVEDEGVHNEFRLVCHYCTHMTQFYSVRDPQWNFYAAVNEEFAYRYTPLRHAILAWASLHLSIKEGKGEENPTAQKFYQSALKGLMVEDFSKSVMPLEVLLVGSFFLCLFDLMAGQDELKSILRHVWTSLRLGGFFEQPNLRQMSSLSYQIIVWMIYLDVRCSLFVGNIQFPNYIEVETTRSKQRVNVPEGDIQYLLTSELYEKRVIADIFGNSKQVLKSSFGPRYPEESAQQDDVMDRILVVMVKNMLMFATLVRLRNWLSECGNSLEYRPGNLLTRIRELRRETEHISEMANRDSISRFHVLVELALTYAITIYFDRICNPDVRTSPECQLAASRIVDIAMLLKKHRAKGTPGSLQWPFPLVIAGVETTDPVQQSWVLSELDENVKDGWGMGVKKTKDIVRATIQRQNEQGRRMDLGEVMMEMGMVTVI